MKKYKADDLLDFMNEEVSWEIQCSSCGYSIGGYEEAIYITDELFKEGWKATKQNVYCPKCATKKLKSIFK